MEQPVATRPQSEARIVADLVGAGLVPPDRSTEAEAVVAGSLSALVLPPPVTAGSPGTGRGTRSRLVEVAGYVGGALVVAAVGLFVSQSLADLSDAGQVGMLVVIALVLVGAATTTCLVGGGYDELRRGDDEVRRRLASALLVAGGFSASVALGRVVDLAQGDAGSSSSLPVLVSAVSLLLLTLASGRVATSALLHLAAGAAVVVAALAVEGLRSDLGTEGRLAAGLLLGAAAGWLLVARAGRFAEPVVARTVGWSLALLGAQLPLAYSGSGNVAYALTAVVVVAAVVVYLGDVQWPGLVAAVVGVSLVVPEATADWFDGSLGVAGVVLVTGLTLLGASLAGLGVRRQAGEQQE